MLFLRNVRKISGHRSSIRKHSNTFIARFLNLSGRSMDDIRIQPNEHMTRRPGESDQDVTIGRLDRERFWMLETMYPYGLNNRLQHVGSVSSSNVDPETLVLIFLTVISAFDDKTLDVRQTLRCINSAICITRVIMTYIFFLRLFIASGYNIYINFSRHTNSFLPVLITVLEVLF